MTSAPPPLTTSVGAILLCGGQSRRMGRPKAWLPFGSETLLQRVVRVLRDALGPAAPIALVAAPGQELPPLADDASAFRADDEVVGRGPLQGLVTGLAALPEPAEWVYVSSVDAPFLHADWVRLLLQEVQGHDLAIPEAQGRHHPLAASYRRSTVLPAARRLLADDRLRPVFLMDLLDAAIVNEERLRKVDPTLAALRNLNTPDDYREALRLAGLPDPDAAGVR